MINFLLIKNQWLRPESFSFFNFSTFVSAVALLAIVYTISDFKYHFRISVSSIPVRLLTFVFISLIGIGTLLTDLWFSEKWKMPLILSNQGIWQGVFGLMFLVVIIIWLWISFFKKPIFSKYNYKRYFNALYLTITNGVSNHLAVLSSELLCSINSIVDLSFEDDYLNTSDKSFQEGIEYYAYNTILLIGNKKFCKYLIAHSSITAILLFESIRDRKKYNIPIGPFSRNITIEALKNKDSVLYQETGLYEGGLVGHIKPFIKTVYGSYDLIENLAVKNKSPLDIPGDNIKDFISLKAYCSCVLETWKSYLNNENREKHSYSLGRAFDLIVSSCMDIPKLNTIPLSLVEQDVLSKFSEVVEFLHRAICLFNEKISPDEKELYSDSEIFISLVGSIMKLIWFSSNISAPADTCWHVQYGILWHRFFDDLYNGFIWDRIRKRLRRELYNDIITLKKSPNFKSAKLLGFVLNVFGFSLNKSFNLCEYSLHRVILSWVKLNYLNLYNEFPDVAKACLIGKISFDENESRLVATYAKSIYMKPYKEYLDLK